MKKLPVLLLLTLVLGFTVSCKKKTNPTPTSSTNQNLLKTWKPSKVLENTLDVTSSFSAYRITFEEANGEKKFTLVDRQSKTLTGTWAIASDETTITLTFADKSTKVFSSVSIAAGELKYTGKEQGKAGDVSVTFVLVPA